MSPEVTTFLRTATTAYGFTFVVHLSQATAQVTPAPLVCQSSATGEITQSAAPQQALAVYRNPARTETESPDPVLLCPNTQPPPPPLATHRVHQYGVPHPVNDSTGGYLG